MLFVSFVVTTVASVAVKATEYEYKVSERPYSHSGAKGYCEQAFSGELVSITSTEERDTVHNMVKASNAGTNYWTAGERSSSSSTGWEYADGSEVPMTFGGKTVWAKKEPNNYGGKEDCIAVRVSGGWEKKWNDATCNSNFLAVCKREKIANPYKRDGWYARKTGSSEGTCYYKYFNRVLHKKIAPYRRRSWSQAEAFCGKQVNGGGHLASITSAQEQEYVHDLVYNVYDDFENRPVWIGGRRDEEDGVYWKRWSDGKEMVYTNWMDGMPNLEVRLRNWGKRGLTEEKCVQMSHSHVKAGDSFRQLKGGKRFTQHVGQKGEWNDARCNLSRGFVCKVCTDEDYGDDDGQN